VRENWDGNRVGCDVFLGPGRIMFGTDEGASEEMYRNYFRWLETDDEYFPYAQYPAQGRGMVYGLGLPDDVLEKVYHGNAERLFGQFRGAPAAAR
jgi:predicted TIM-barrel fold metal-dependent hydrolase